MFCFCDIYSRRAKEKEEAEIKKAKLKSKVNEAAERNARIESRDENLNDLSFDEQMKRGLRHKKLKLSKDNPEVLNVSLPDDEENRELRGLKTFKNKKTGKLEFQWDASKEPGSSRSSDSSSESSEEEEVENEEDRYSNQGR